MTTKTVTCRLLLATMDDHLQLRQHIVTELGLQPVTQSTTSPSGDTEEKKVIMVQTYRFGMCPLYAAVNKITAMLPVKLRNGDTRLVTFYVKELVAIPDEVPSEQADPNIWKDGSLPMLSVCAAEGSPQGMIFEPPFLATVRLHHQISGPSSPSTISSSSSPPIVDKSVPATFDHFEATLKSQGFLPVVEVGTKETRDFHRKFESKDRGMILSMFCGPACRSSYKIGGETFVYPLNTVHHLLHRSLEGLTPLSYEVALFPHYSTTFRPVGHLTLTEILQMVSSSS